MSHLISHRRLKHRRLKYVEVLCGRSACVVLIAEYIADVAPECPLENDFGATISVQASNAPLAATRSLRLRARLFQHGQPHSALDRTRQGFYRKVKRLQAKSSPAGSIQNYTDRGGCHVHELQWLDASKTLKAWLWKGFCPVYRSRCAGPRWRSTGTAVICARRKHCSSSCNWAVR